MKSIAIRDINDSAITKKININKMNIMLKQGMYKEVKSGDQNIYKTN